MTDQMKVTQIIKKRNTYRASHDYAVEADEYVEVLVNGDSVLRSTPPPGTRWAIHIDMRIIETEV